MKGDIEKMLDEIDDFKKDYYQKIIGLHNNSRLRNLSVQCDKNYGFTIFKKDDSSDWLAYGKSGFRVYSNGSDWQSSEQASMCKIHNGKLVISKRYTENELLDVFPDVSIGEIEEKIVSEIKKLKIYGQATKNNSNSRFA